MATTSSSEKLKVLETWIEGFVITPMASVGILLNIFGLVLLLTERRREKMFNLLLSTLLIFDTLFLCFNLIKSVATNLIVIPDNYLPSYYLILKFIVYPGSRFSLMSSIFMTLALSHSRFRAVNKPIQHRNSLKSARNRIKYLLTYIIPILTASIILTIPCFWESAIEKHENTTKPAALIPSKFRQNPYYSIFYVGVLHLGLLGIAPFAMLVFITIKISKGINQNSYDITRLTSSQRRNVRIFNQKRNRTLVVNLIAVFFLIFHLLRLGLTSVEFIIQIKLNNNNSSAIVYEMGCEFPFFLNLLTSISELLLVINSSVNAIIYQGVCLFSPSPLQHKRSGYTSSITSSPKKRRHISRLSEKRISKELINDKICCKMCNVSYNNCQNMWTRETCKYSEKRREKGLMKINVSSKSFKAPKFQVIKHGTEYV